MKRKPIYILSSPELKNYLELYRAHLTIEANRRCTISDALETLIENWFSQDCPTPKIVTSAGGTCISRMDCTLDLWQDLVRRAAAISSDTSIGVSVLIRSLLQESKDRHDSQIQTLPAQSKNAKASLSPLAGTGD